MSKLTCESDHPPRSVLHEPRPGWPNDRGPSLESRAIELPETLGALGANVRRANRREPRGASLADRRPIEHPSVANRERRRMGAVSSASFGGVAWRATMERKPLMKERPKTRPPLSAAIGLSSIRRE